MLTACLLCGCSALLSDEVKGHQAEQSRGITWVTINQSAAFTRHSQQVNSNILIQLQPSS